MKKITNKTLEKTCNYTYWFFVAASTIVLLFVMNEYFIPIKHDTQTKNSTCESIGFFCLPFSCALASIATFLSIALIYVNIKYIKNTKNLKWQEILIIVINYILQLLIIFPYELIVLLTIIFLALAIILYLSSLITPDCGYTKINQRSMKFLSELLGLASILSITVSVCNSINSAEGLSTLSGETTRIIYALGISMLSASATIKISLAFDELQNELENTLSKKYHEIKCTISKNITGMSSNHRSRLLCMHDEIKKNQEVSTAKVIAGIFEYAKYVKDNSDDLSKPNNHDHTKVKELCESVINSQSWLAHLFFRK